MFHDFFVPSFLRTMSMLMFMFAVSFSFSIHSFFEFWSDLMFNINTISKL